MWGGFRSRLKRSFRFWEDGRGRKRIVRRRVVLGSFSLIFDANSVTGSSELCLLPWTGAFVVCFENPADCSKTTPKREIV